MNVNSRSGFWTVATFALLIFTVTSRPATADDDSLKRRVLEEYPKLAEQLATAYSNVRAEARLVSRSEVGQSQESRITTSLQFARTDANMLIINDIEADDKTRSIPRNAQPDAVGSPDETLRRAEEPQDTVMCVNAQNAFRLSRRDRRSPYIIEYAENNLKPIQMPTMSTFNESIDVAFRAGGYQISSFLRNPAVVIDRVSELPDIPGRALVKIDFTYENKKPPAKTKGAPRTVSVKRGSFVVSPGEKWALRSYELKFFQPYGYYNRLGSIEYDTTSAGPPIPKKVIIRTVNEISEGAKFDPKRIFPGVQTEKVYEFRDFKLGPVPDREFLLSSYSLPDVTKPGEIARPGMSTGYVLLATSIVGMVLVVLIRLYLKRSGTSIPSK